MAVTAVYCVSPLVHAVVEKEFEKIASCKEMYWMNENANTVTTGRVLCAALGILDAPWATISRYPAGSYHLVTFQPTPDTERSYGVKLVHTDAGWHDTEADAMQAAEKWGKTKAKHLA